MSQQTFTIYFNALETPAWLKLSLQKSEILLKLQGACSGTFFVRSSDSFPDCVVLSYVNTKNIVIHELISNTANTKFRFKSDTVPFNTFHSLIALIERCYEDKPPFIPCTLIPPIPRDVVHPMLAPGIKILCTIMLIYVCVTRYNKVRLMGSAYCCNYVPNLLAPQTLLIIILPSCFINRKYICTGKCG